MSTACVAAMTRLHDAPSARWDRQTTTASTPQISHVPRCGRVVPRKMSRTYGTVSAIPTSPASTPSTGVAAVIAAARSPSACRRSARPRPPPRRRRRTGGRRRRRRSSARDLVGMHDDRAGLDELHRRPALQLAGAEPLQRQRTVRLHPDRLDHRRHERPDALGIGERAAVAAVQVDRREHPPGGDAAVGAAAAESRLRSPASSGRLVLPGADQQRPEPWRGRRGRG